ncbi:sulfurtransferase TusA family protein [Catenovulum sediminis]|uniref:Sulfurtransferase TusA family protein n=1 Tax=Catenovulum sediminis TaxID=1740262 RepID=A0ABV1RLZ6_9ALTE|nr:sulfurtransferase TusA family protein [Catenovulum sediminis]
MLIKLDCRHMFCPMPLLQLKLKLKDCQASDTLELWISDKSSLKDIPAWLEFKGYSVEILEVEPHLYRLRIKLGKGK